MSETAEAPKKPFLRIIKGNPDDTEVAALTTLFAVMASNAGSQERAPRDRNMWGNLSERLSSPMSYNPSSFQNVNFY